ncbi:MAG TPA: GNAT family N-acetyltransferase [Thermoanaerobaculia bacterium]|nr:GNAT family N-acetyltransferase [Thermoanaerobaculia bacterium]
MRGQKLFIRPIEPADHETVSRFLSEQTGRAAVPVCGLLGKLVGELVAVMAMQITADALQIDDIVVAAGLRGKRIGRVMLDEAEQIAAKIDRTRLVVNTSHEFFRRTGFEREGERWIRQVRSHGAQRESQ